MKNRTARFVMDDYTIEMVLHCSRNNRPARNCKNCPAKDLCNLEFKGYDMVVCPGCGAPFKVEFGSKKVFRCGICGALISYTGQK